MADAGPPAPQIQPQAPQQPHQPVQPSVAPNKPVPAQEKQHIPQLIGSYFKLEFAGKPEEDAEAHLLRMIRGTLISFQKV